MGRAWNGARGLWLAVALAVSGVAEAQETVGPDDGGDPLQPLTCLLQPWRSSAIGSDHIGIVSSVNVRRADRVTEGTVLVELDPDLMEAEIAVTQISVDGLKAKLARSETLGQRRLIPADEIEQMRTDLKLAEATLARARIALEKTRIRAPFDGVVSDVRVAEGQLTGNEPLIQLTETRDLRAEMVFVDSAFGKIAVNQGVTLDLPLIGQTVSAKVIAIDPFLDPASNTFVVSAVVANEDWAIPAGIGCSVTSWDQ